MCCSWNCKKLVHVFCKFKIYLMRFLEFLLQINRWRFREPLLFDGSSFNPCKLLVQFQHKNLNMFKQ